MGSCLFRPSHVQCKFRVSMSIVRYASLSVVHDLCTQDSISATQLLSLLGQGAGRSCERPAEALLKAFLRCVGSSAPLSESSKACSELECTGLAVQMMG